MCVWAGGGKCVMYVTAFPMEISCEAAARNSTLMGLVYSLLTNKFSHSDEANRGPGTSVCFKWDKDDMACEGLITQ